MNEDWGIYYLLKNAPSLPIIVRNDPMYFYKPAGHSGSRRKALCVELGFYADISAKVNSKIILIIHSPQECFLWVACLWSKMPMFQRAGMRKGGLPLPLAFQYLILMTWRDCNLDLVMVSSLASKWQGLKVGMPVFQLFYEMKLKTS